MTTELLDGTSPRERADRAWFSTLRRMGQAMLRVPRRFSWLPPLAWAGFIFGLSSHRAPLGDLPGTGAMAFLGNLAHAFEFGVLLLLLVPLLPRVQGWVRWNRPMTVLLPVAVFLFAVSDEVHQSMVPGRDASVFDLCTDLAGILCVYWVVRRLEVPGGVGSGMRTLLLRGLLLCCVCATVATVWGVIWEEGPWPFPS